MYTADIIIFMATPPSFHSSKLKKLMFNTVLLLLSLLLIAVSVPLSLSCPYILCSCLYPFWVLLHRAIILPGKECLAHSWWSCDHIQADITWLPLSCHSVYKPRVLIHVLFLSCSCLHPCSFSLQFPTSFAFSWSSTGSCVVLAVFKMKTVQSYARAYTVTSSCVPIAFNLTHSQMLLLNDEMWGLLTLAPRNHSNRKFLGVQCRG